MSNVETVRRIAEAVSSHDVETALAVTDPGVAWHSSLSVIAEGGAYHGHEGVRQYFHDVDETFESWEFQIDDALGVGDTVIAVGRLNYRGKASGVSSTASMGWVFLFEHGKVVYTRAFRDPEQTLAAVGRPD